MTLIMSVALFLVSCGSSNYSFKEQNVIRMAVDTPEYFDNPKMHSFDKECRSPLTDPRDGTEINFLRASWPVADYKVPTGKYGVRQGELLRVSCETGEAVGIVKR